MVGKIKRIRQKLHQDAVKVDRSQSGIEKALPAEVKGLALPGIIKAFDLNQRTNKSDNTKEGTLKVGCAMMSANAHLLVHCILTGPNYKSWCTEVVAFPAKSNHIALPNLM